MRSKRRKCPPDREASTGSHPPRQDRRGGKDRGRRLTDPRPARAGQRRRRDKVRPAPPGTGARGDRGHNNIVQPSESPVRRGLADDAASRLSPRLGPSGCIRVAVCGCWRLCGHKRSLALRATRTLMARSQATTYLPSADLPSVASPPPAQRRCPAHRRRPTASR